MSDDLVTRLAATDDDEERAKLASELLPDYSEEFYTLLGRHATLDIPQRILDGWDDDEILDSVANSIPGTPLPRRASGHAHVAAKHWPRPQAACYAGFRAALGDSARSATGAS